MKQPAFHFEDDIWLDVVRGIENPASGEVERHLRSGCQTCESAFRLWTGVRDHLPDALLPGPSDEVVRSVVAAYDFQRKIPLLSTLADFARLLFDSSLEPVPFGVRGANSPARHLLHEAPGALIDLRIEQDAAMPVCITGQIHPSESSESTQEATTVFVVEDEQRIIASALANHLGEFQIEFDPKGRLSMYLDMPGAQVIGIPLPDLDTAPNQWKN